LFKLSHRMELALLIALVTVLVACFLSPLIWEASDNFRLVAVSPMGWGTDQQNYLSAVETALNADTLRIRRPGQGLLYANLALAPLFVARHITSVSQQAIIIVLRLWSVLFAAATVILAFIFSLRYFGRAAAWLAALFLLTMSFEFIRMSVVAHSDTAQVFFMLLALYFCCRFAETGKAQQLALASAAAGFAFASKFAGIFLLPILAVVVLLRAANAGRLPGTSVMNAPHPRLKLFLPIMVGMACLALAVLASPEMARRFYKGYKSIGLSTWLLVWATARFTMFMLGCGSILVYVLRPTRAWLLRHDRLLDIWAALALSGAAFGLAVFLSTPLAFGDLITGFSVESAHVTVGHGFAADDVGVFWLKALVQPGVLSPSISILCLLAIGALLYRVATRGTSELLTPESILVGWIVSYLLLLFIRIRYYDSHFLLPVIPSMIILSVATLRRVFDRLRNSLSPQMATATSVVLAALILGVGAYHTSSTFHEYRLGTVAEFQGAVEAGRWLTEHYPPATRTRILYDAPAYIPPQFGDAYPTWSGTRELLDKIDPQVVVIIKGVADQFADLGLGQKYLGGQEAFRASHDFYGSFHEGAGSYRLQFEAETTRVYEKR
jgi:hypothetical protein